MERISPLHDIMECIYVYDMSMMHPFHVNMKIRPLKSVTDFVDGLKFEEVLLGNSALHCPLERVM